MNVAGLPTWFGVNFGYWQHYEITPLWFGFQDLAWEKEEQILTSLGPRRHKNPPEYIDAVGIILIRLRTGTEYEALKDYLVEQVEGIAVLLRGGRT